MVKYCPKCGVENVDTSKFCSKCGSELRNLNTLQSNTTDNNSLNTNPNTNLNMNNNMNNEGSNNIYYEDKSPGVAALLSFILVGAGFLYIHQADKFAIYFIIAIVLSFITVFTLGFGAIILIPFLIYQIYAAYKATKEYNIQKRLTYN